MGMIEDAFAAMQTVIAPELKVLSVRLDNVEKQMTELRSDMKDLRSDMKDLRSDMKEFRAEVRSDIADSERRTEQRYNDIMGGIRSVVDFAKFDQRLAKIEDQQRPSDPQKQIEQ